jgi:hypothetical protein
LGNRPPDDQKIEFPPFILETRDGAPWFRIIIFTLSKKEYGMIDVWKSNLEKTYLLAFRNSLGPETLGRYRNNGMLNEKVARLIDIPLPVHDLLFPQKLIILQEPCPVVNASGLCSLTI